MLGGILVHSFLQILSKSLRFRGCCSATRSFSSLHRFLMGFRSGDWLGHYRTLICFFLSHSFVALAVCFGSLGCGWVFQNDIFSTLTEGRRLSPKVSWYMAPFILPSIRWSRPVPLAEKHLQSIRFPPPCLTVGMVFLGLHFSSSKHGESSWSQIALFWSHMTTSPSPKSPPDHAGVLWQTSDGTVHCTPCTHSRILIIHGVLCYWWFSSWLWSQLQVINKLLLCSTGLIPDLSHHHSYPTRRDLAWSLQVLQVATMFQQNTTFPRIPPSAGECGHCNPIPPINISVGYKMGRSETPSLLFFAVSLLFHLRIWLTPQASLHSETQTRRSSPV